MKIQKRLVLFILLVIVAAGAVPALASPQIPQAMPAATAAPTPAGLAGVGPDDFPQGFNPLTGLPVEDPELLKLPPAMVSVTNFPVSARPQAGLSFAPYVFEMYIGMGMTRYLAMFYGEFPKVQPGGAEGQNQNAAVGPIRSGRLPYESFRRLYNGALVMSGASAEVGAQLYDSVRVYGSDEEDINSTMINIDRLQKIAEANARHAKGPVNLTANRYEANAPAGGSEAQKINVFYNFYNQSLWNYDASVGAYLRSQDEADGSGKFVPALDRLTGEQLAFENVVVLFADHTAVKPTIIDIDLLYTQRPALLFRDGQVYRIFWNTVSGEYEQDSGLLRPIRFVDEQGNAFPMKPGQTWVEVVTPTTTARETAAGEWKVRFYAP